uniref:Protein containing ABC transporter-like domain protein n=1 Tax=uncultured organism TaxID=155900 RepID=M1Q1F2_9ZZZZ|nr:protein containing ABC transporter-like domain protein [uncultured organism]
MSKLKAKGIDFAYNGGDLVLKDVDMELNEGEILALVGPNGSGKSTLLKCLADFHSPDKGSVNIDKKNISDYSLNEKARKLGYVPQIENISFPSTVFDTILMGRKPYISWKPSKKDKRIVSDLIEKMELSDLAMRDINELSGGQRQKVFVARALAQQPKIMLLDEPTSNLDLKHQLEVLNIVKEQAESGISSIIAIHDLNMAIRYSDKIVMLKEGEVFASGGMEVVSQENIRDVYEVNVHVSDHAGWLTVTPDEPISEL